MDRTTGQRNAAAFLYPPIDPFDQQMLDVGDGHQLYVEQCGNPDGKPVLVLHGGPGGGCSPAMRRYFDPACFRIILFDQRGCGRSKPNASVEHNTTWHLIADIEKIRATLGIDTWFVFGGSWGATLGLVYAQTHPDHVRHLVLRGVFLMEQQELDWFYRGGAGRFWPENWARFVGLLDETERHDPISAYHQRLFSGKRAEELRFARAWAAWENGLASIDSNGSSADGPAEYVRAFARLENHYFMHKGFLDTDGQILRDLQRIRGIGVSIVQGRFDMICPPDSAMRLHRSLRRSELYMVPRAGHALSEPGITDQLVKIMDRLAARP